MSWIVDHLVERRRQRWSSMQRIGRGRYTALVVLSAPAGAALIFSFRTLLTGQPVDPSMLVGLLGFWAIWIAITLPITLFEWPACVRDFGCTRGRGPESYAAFCAYLVPILCLRDVLFCPA